MSIELSERTDFDHRRDIDGYKGYEILRKCGNEVCDYNIYDINEYSFSTLSIYGDLSKVIYEFLCQSMARFDSPVILLFRCSALLCVISAAAGCRRVDVSTAQRFIRTKLFLRCAETCFIRTYAMQKSVVRMPLL